MQLEAMGSPIKYRLKTGEEVLLRPGVPMDVPDRMAKQLLRKAPDKVRIVTDADQVTIAPAAPNARPVYWERGDGSIVGPATVTDLAKVDTGPNARFWVIVEYEGQVVWVLADRLRSERQFREQRPLRAVTRIRELK